MPKIRPRRRPYKPPPIGLLQDRCPQLAVLRDRLASRVVIADDLPAIYIRALFNLPQEQEVWSRSDAIRTVHAGQSHSAAERDR